MRRWQVVGRACSRTVHGAHTAQCLNDRRSRCFEVLQHQDHLTSPNVQEAHDSFVTRTMFSGHPSCGSCRRPLLTRNPQHPSPAHLHLAPPSLHPHTSASAPLHLTPARSYPGLSSGVVTPAMLSIDKRPLVAVGGCEALAQLLFMAGAAHIPGPLLPVVNQTYLVWSLVVASVLLGARWARGGEGKGVRDGGGGGEGVRLKRG